MSVTQAINSDTAAFDKGLEDIGFYGPQINLKGIIMGSTDLNPVAMSRSYIPFLRNSPYYKQHTASSEFTKTNKLKLTDHVVKLMETASSVCFELAEKCQSVTSSCKAAHDVCRRIFIAPLSLDSIDQYDIFRHCDRDRNPLCSDAADLRKYLLTHLRDLGVSSDRGWMTCNALVAERFAEERMKDFSFLVPEILSEGVQILMYGTDYDYTENWMGQLMTIANLNMPGKEHFFGSSRNFKSVLDGTFHFESGDGQGGGEGKAKGRGTLSMLRIKGKDVSTESQAQKADDVEDRTINQMVGNWVRYSEFGDLNRRGDWVEKTA